MNREAVPFDRGCITTDLGLNHPLKYKKLELNLDAFE